MYLKKIATPPNQFFILCKSQQTIKLTSDRVHSDMLVLKFGDFFSKLHFPPIYYLPTYLTTKDLS